LAAVPEIHFDSVDQYIYAARRESGLLELADRLTRGVEAQFVFTPETAQLQRLSRQARA
jgi:hypothetical protein